MRKVTIQLTTTIEIHQSFEGGTFIPRENGCRDKSLTASSPEGVIRRIQQAHPGCEIKIVEEGTYTPTPLGTIIVLGN